MLVDPGWVGCVGCVGALVVGALEVGALLVEGGAFVRCVGDGVNVGAGAWSLFLAGTLAGGGNFSMGWPSSSAFITAAQVAVG